MDKNSYLLILAGVLSFCGAILQAVIGFLWSPGCGSGVPDRTGGQLEAAVDAQTGG